MNERRHGGGGGGGRERERERNLRGNGEMFTRSDRKFQTPHTVLLHRGKTNAIQVTCILRVLWLDRAAQHAGLRCQLSGKGWYKRTQGFYKH